MGGGVAVVGVVVMWVMMECVVGGGGVGWAIWLCRFNSAAVSKKVFGWHGQLAFEEYVDAHVLTESMIYQVKGVGMGLSPRWRMTTDLSANFRE